MKYGLQTWGSHGDVEPFMALAGALADAGHEVELAITTQGDHEVVAPAGVRVLRAGGDMTQAEGDALLDRVIALKSPVAQGKMVLEQGLLPFADAMYEAAAGLVSRNDVVIRHHFLYMTQVAAELGGVPEVSVYLTPDLLPTAERPPTGMPSLGPLQLAGWWLANKGISSVFGAPAQELRAKHGLPRSRGVLHDIWPSSVANLVAVSPTLFPRPADWPDSTHLTGFWRAPSSVDAAVDDRLAAFLEGGTPPVFATFGSMSGGTGPRREADAGLLIAASREAGRRLVLQQPPGPPPPDTGDDILVVHRAPHAAVFPRCAAVVHHGGAGTTQTAVVAGTPSVIVPHLADQFFWGARMRELGVGYATRARSSVTSSELARVIDRAVADEKAHESAAALGRSLSAERGLARAVEVLASLA